MSVYSGSCLCGSVTYKAKGELFWPPKTVPVFVDQWSGKEWHGNGIRMRTH